jgi:hypothetical protein
LRPCFSCYQQNSFQHTGEVGQHFVVVETQDAIAVRFQMLCSGGVLLGLLLVNAAIHFDDQFVCGAVEVEDEWPDGILVAESQPT